MKSKLTDDERKLLGLLLDYKFVREHIAQIKDKLLLIPKEHLRIINAVLGNKETNADMEKLYNLSKDTKDESANNDTYSSEDLSKRTGTPEAGSKKEG